MLTIGSLVVESLDYIFIVDKNYRIIYNTRYDDRLNNESADYSSYDIHNKKFFDVFPKNILWSFISLKILKMLPKNY